MSNDDLKTRKNEYSCSACGNELIPGYECVLVVPKNIAIPARCPYYEIDMVLPKWTLKEQKGDDCNGK